jgi:hypothetical protein
LAVAVLVLHLVRNLVLMGLTLYFLASLLLEAVEAVVTTQAQAGLVALVVVVVKIILELLLAAREHQDRVTMVELEEIQQAVVVVAQVQ